MSQTPTPFTYRPLRAPADDRELLIQPALAATAAMVARNQQSIAASDSFEIGGCALRCLRDSGRAELLDAAHAYTSQYRPAAAIDRTRPIVLSGHQPELFHPGVWCKNFVLDRHRRMLGGNSIHLLIDSDTIKTSSLSVPAGSIAEPHIERVAFDEALEEIPWEERGVANWSVLESFGERCSEQLAQLVPDPMLKTFWPQAIEHCRRENNLGRGLSAARHALEGDWGLSTLEVPVSRLCGSRAFCVFAYSMLDQANRFASIYNQTLDEYRVVHGIRSANHPVPRLEQTADGCEVPFWLWHVDAPRRQRAFVERAAGNLRLTDRNDISVNVPNDREGAVETLQRLGSQGIKLRSRALVTTLAARLIFSDLFLHGIGGAKYDQLTDTIAARFFAFSLPGFQTVSATLRLPTAHPHAAESEWRRARAELRDLAWHPEKHLPAEVPEAQQLPESQQLKAQLLVNEKRRWIATEVNHTTARPRFEALRRTTSELRPYVERTRKECEARRVSSESAMVSERILNSREYSFVLYPKKFLGDFLLEVRSKVS